MIFLFGGGFEKGDPTRDLHAPDYFMMKDLVFITVGYRLGPLGKIIYDNYRIHKRVKYLCLSD